MNNPEEPAVAASTADSRGVEALCVAAAGKLRGVIGTLVVDRDLAGGAPFG